MRWQPVVLALAIALSVRIVPAIADPVGPVCRQATVVDVMARELRTRWYYVRIDPALIQEAPTQSGVLIRCGVCAMIAWYDMPRYGEQPVARCEPHLFSVQVVRNGFVVRYLQ